MSNRRKSPAVKAARRRCALLLCLFVPFAGLAAGNDVQPSYESAGLPKAEYLVEDMRAHAGKKFWIRRAAQGQAAEALFCDSTEAPSTKDCPGKPFSVAGPEAFTIEDTLIAKPDPALSWFRIRFDSGRTGYLSLEDFTRHRYKEDRVSAEQLGIDYALSHSGWIFDDYPPRILGERRAQLEANTDPRLAQEEPKGKRVTRFKLLYPGMTAQQVLNSIWGRPNSVSVTASGRDRRRLEQWDYGSGILLYFEDGRLTRIDRGHW